MFRRRDVAAQADLPEAETMTMARLEMPRRVFDVPLAPSQGRTGPSAATTGRVAVAGFGPVLVDDSPDAAGAGDGDAARQLAVGRGIRVDGDIRGCAKLVIEGEVKATLEACDHLTVAEGGRFDGRGEVETAEIAGAFEGTLHVRGRLLIRAKGRVRGDIRFGELEIERGGQLAGNVDAHVKGPQLAPVAAAGGSD